MHYKTTLIVAAALVAAASASALTVEVQRFKDGQPLPVGYQNVADGIDAAEVLLVSQAPFVDYLIPNNSGAAGITAQKEGGQYIVSSNIATFEGANNLVSPDKWHVVFEWDDGTPLPFGADFYGVSWKGWTSTTVATLETRVDLATDKEVTVYHWFNDGWNYKADGSGHTILDGHVLTVTQYKASGAQVDQKVNIIPSGEAVSFFGDHRMFASSIIKATRTAAGDYLIIKNEGGNVGYKGTAVALLESGPVTGPGEFSDYVLVNGWVDSGAFMGWVNVEYYPWIYVQTLGKYLYSAGGQWYYISK